MTPISLAPIGDITPPGSRSRRAWRLLRAGMALLLLAYVALLTYLWVTQDKRVFFPQPLAAAQADQVLQQLPGARSVWLTAPDGTRLHAWWRPAGAQTSAKGTLLYFGGNAEAVHWRLALLAHHGGWDLLLTDYRGYGLSAGQPGQAAMAADALAWFDALHTGQLAVPRPTAIAVMGTSLGSFFATAVAAERPVAAAILVTPFDSVRDYIQSRMPLVPVGLLLRHPLSSITLAPRVTAPTLMLAAADDITIPPQRARLLFEAWGSQRREWVLLPHTNHITVLQDTGHWQQVHQFLDRIP